MTTPSTVDAPTVEQQARAALDLLIERQHLPQPAKVLWWALGDCPPWLSVRLANEADARTWAQVLDRGVYDEPNIEDLPDGGWRITRRVSLQPNGMVRLPGCAGEHSIFWSETRIARGEQVVTGVPAGVDGAPIGTRHGA